MEISTVPCCTVHIVSVPVLSPLMNRSEFGIEFREPLDRRSPYKS